MSLTRTLALSLLIGMAVPAAARADGLFVPFIGVNFGGRSGHQLSAAIDSERLNLGGSLAYMHRSRSPVTPIRSVTSGTSSSLSLSTFASSKEASTTARS